MLPESQANDSLIARLRKPKAFRMAVFDWLATLALVPIVSRIWRAGTVTSFLLTICVAVTAHKLSGTSTQFNYYLGLNPKVR